MCSVTDLRWVKVKLPSCLSKHHEITFAKESYDLSSSRVHIFSDVVL